MTTEDRYVERIVELKAALRSAMNDLIIVRDGWKKNDDARWNLVESSIREARRLLNAGDPTSAGVDMATITRPPTEEEQAYLDRAERGTEAYSAQRRECPRCGLDISPYLADARSGPRGE